MSMPPRPGEEPEGRPPGYPPSGQPGGTPPAYPPSHGYSPGLTPPPLGYPPYPNHPPGPGAGRSGYPDLPQHPNTGPGGFPNHPGQPPRAYGSDPLVATRLGGWFTRVLRVSGRSFFRISLVTLITGALAAVPVAACAVPAGMLLDPANRNSYLTPVGMGLLLLAVIIGLSAFFFVQAAAFCVAVTDAADQRMPLGQLLRLAGARALPLLAWSFGAQALVMIGYLLVVPGLYLAVVFGTTLLGVVVVERSGPERCFTLIKDLFWVATARLLLGSLLTVTCLVAVYLLSGLIAVGFFTVFTRTGGDPGSLLTGLYFSVRLAVFILPLVVLTTALNAVTYAELRGRQLPGATAGQLADELRRTQ